MNVFLFLLCLAATAFAQPLAPLLENSLGMKLVLIPAGEFMMGNHETAQAMQSSYPQLDSKRLEALQDEKPLHKVRISRAFYMGQTEVTVGQFARFVEQSG